MGLGDVFKKKKFLMNLTYNGDIISRKSVPIKGQIVEYTKKTKLAYLIPDNAPVRDGNNYRIDYDMRDAAPMGDIMDIAPDLIKEVESLWASKYSLCIDMTLNDPEGLLEDNPLTEEERKKLISAKNWLIRYGEAGTGYFYNLMRWGYVKQETWFRTLAYIPKPDTLILPKKYIRTGVIPKMLYAMEKSTIATDIIRRQEPKWEWLKEIILPVIACLSAVIIIYFLTGGHH